MSQRRLLLLSNSKKFGGEYLEYAEAPIRDFLGNGTERVLFIPYAGVTVSFDDYAEKVRARFRAIGYEVDAIQDFPDPQDAVNRAGAIVVGGGNTFQLLSKFYEVGILESVRSRVLAGVPYLGWSAGANMACPTIKTTNDMPIVQPPSFQALDLIPFQINPHFTDARLPKHSGESRSQRIAEFIIANPETMVVGLPEGMILRIEGEERIQIIGEQAVTVFDRAGGETVIRSSEDLAARLLHG